MHGAADEVVELLVGAGADINARDKESWDSCVLLRPPSPAMTTTLHTANTRFTGGPLCCAKATCRCLRALLGDPTAAR